MILLYNSVLLLPLVTFMVLDDPHDCFMCLGKDPERVYSSHQLSRKELAERKMVAKYSSIQVADSTCLKPSLHLS